jgi:hypothetical protein
VAEVVEALRNHIALLIVLSRPQQTMIMMLSRHNASIIHNGVGSSAQESGGGLAAKAVQEPLLQSFWRDPQG